jgi:hypothetical protein
MVLAGRADGGLTDRSPVVVDRNDGVGALVRINAQCDHETVSTQQLMGTGRPVGISQSGR